MKSIVVGNEQVWFARPNTPTTKTTDWSTSSCTVASMCKLVLRWPRIQMQVNSTAPQLDFILAQ
jgi:hypothetical protein